MNLSRTERWILANQYRILEALHPSDAEWLAEHRTVLEHGYELEYSWLCPEVSADDQCMSADACREVLDILDMFGAIMRGYEARSDKAWADARLTLFPGFDGNTEGNQLGYAHHLRKANKFRDQFLGLFGEDRVDFNSHFPTLSRYRSMLAEWNASMNKHELTEDDLLRITGAR